MTYHGSRKQEYEQPNGIRRVEFRYSGDIDESGRLKLKRCVGKSFLDKSPQSCHCVSNGAVSKKDTDQQIACPVLAGRPDRSA